MRRYHPDHGIRDESAIDPRTDLGYPVANPTDQQFRDAGWLPVVDADPVPAGMVSPDGITGAVDGGVYVERHVRLITQAEYDAQIAAQEAANAEAEAERKATPLVYDQTIETPSIILPSDSGGIGYEIFAADDGTLLKIVAHASPLKSPGERAALKASEKAAHYARKADSKTKSDSVKDKGAKIKNAADLIPIIEALQAQIDALGG
jgi:hypothetical protein